MASFRAAWAEGADAIETDLRLTRDGRIVCMHDVTVDRTTNGKGKVAELSFDEIRELDAGKGEKVPTLAEMLAVVPSGKQTYIEIKIGPEIIPQMKKEILVSKLPLGRIVFIAFDDKVVTALKQALPTVKTYWLFAFKKKDGKWNATHDEVIENLKASKADGLDVGFTKESAEMVNAELAQKVKAAKLDLLVWTVNDAELARRALDLGAGGITTDAPGSLRAALSSHRSPGR